MQLPQCRSPHHPTTHSRDSMILLEETISHYCFACVSCKDVGHQLSVQIRTKPEYARYIAEQPDVQQHREQIARAKYVERKQGRVTYFR